MRFRGVLASVGAVLIAGLGLSAWPARAAAPNYPVPWMFTAGLLAATHDGPDVPPPGSNVPCRPSAAHPYPVVLVHGLSANQNINWQTISPFLADYGFCVYSLTYGNRPAEPTPFNRYGGYTDMTQSARQLAAFVQHVLAVTGAAKVDLVGHSEGGTMPDWYLKFLGGYRHVDRYVVISGVLHGTTFWGMSQLYAMGQPWGMSQWVASQMASSCSSCTQFLPSSAFINALDDPHAPGGAPSCVRDGAAVDGVSYVSLATTNDELVRPQTSGFLSPACPGTRNIVVQSQCELDQSDHVSIVADPVAAYDVLNALDPGHPRPVPCRAVAPGIGAPDGL